MSEEILFHAEKHGRYSEKRPGLRDKSIDSIILIGALKLNNYG